MVRAPGEASDRTERLDACEVTGPEHRPVGARCDGMWEQLELSQLVARRIVSREGDGCAAHLSSRAHGHGRDSGRRSERRCCGIAFHGSSVVCWRFAHLHAFTNATFARIDIGVQGKSGNIVVALSTGPRLHHQGCVPVSAKLVKTIEDHPRGYYVNIHSTTYPGGAVRVAGTPVVAVSVPVTIRTSRFTAGIFWTAHFADRPSADPTLLVLRGSVLYDRLQAYFDRLWWQSVPSSAEGQ
jgi:hypothetical protein